MTIGNDQRVFTKLISKLILWAYEQGYELTFGDAWAKTGHIAGSFHYSRLAIDLNLFKDGVWLQTTEGHKPLGEHWESLDPKCTWGGRFKRADGNHYSYGEGD